MKYSEERKRSVLAKLSLPHNRTIKEVSDQEGLSLATLYSCVGRPGNGGSCSLTPVARRKGGRPETSSQRSLRRRA